MSDEALNRRASLFTSLLDRVQTQYERLGRIRELEERWYQLQSLSSPETLDLLAEWVGEYVRFFDKTGCVLGVSGGVDSTLVAIVVARIPGRHQGLIMPSLHADPSDEEDARALCATIGLPYRVCDLSAGMAALLPALGTTLEDAPPRHLGNLAARVRVGFQYYDASIHNRLVIGTGDMDESYIGYSSQGLAADLYPINGLHKDEVRELTFNALADLDRNLAYRLAERPASPGYWVGHKSEDQIGMSYSRVGRSVDVIARQCRVARVGVLPQDADSFAEHLDASGVTDEEFLHVVDTLIEHYSLGFGSPVLFRPEAVVPFGQS